MLRMSNDGIHDGPRPLTSNSLPFEIDHYTLEGSAGPASTPTHVVTVGPSVPQRRSYPAVTEALRQVS